MSSNFKNILVEHSVISLIFSLPLLLYNIGYCNARHFHLLLLQKNFRICETVILVNFFTNPSNFQLPKLWIAVAKHNLKLQKNSIK